MEDTDLFICVTKIHYIYNWVMTENQTKYSKIFLNNNIELIKLVVLIDGIGECTNDQYLFFVTNDLYLLITLSTYTFSKETPVIWKIK